MSETITKKELILHICDETGLTKNQVSLMLHSYMDKVTNELSKGNTVVMRNFGAFEVKMTKAKLAHNPKSPEIKIPIPAKSVVRFKPSKHMKEQTELAINKITSSL